MNAKVDKHLCAKLVREARTLTESIACKHGGAFHIGTRLDRTQAIYNKSLSRYRRRLDVYNALFDSEWDAVTFFIDVYPDK